jgi:hypothetical protein
VPALILYAWRPAAETLVLLLTVSLLFVPAGAALWLAEHARRRRSHGALAGAVG